MYYLIDQPFKDWISSIDSNEQIPDKIIEWRKELKKSDIKTSRYNSKTGRK